jgi:hypothetical protein
MNWLAPLLLLAAQATTPAATPAVPASSAAAGQTGPTRNIDPRVAAQVPVIAGKLNQWRGAWGVAGGKIACKTINSSGDEEIDALGCASMIACVKPAFPVLKAIADGPGTTEDKQRKLSTKLATLQPCMKEHRGQGIAELALKRGRA